MAKQDLQAVQEKQELGQVIGELSQSWLNRAVKEPLEKAEKKRQEAEQLADTDPVRASRLSNEAKQLEAEYGLGSNLQLGVRAVTAALQGLATRNGKQAVVGASSPYLNQAIKQATTNADGTINIEANLIAHTVLGVLEAKATGNNALAGGLGAFTAEAVAPLVMKQLYQTENPADLTEKEKQKVRDLSQIAAGLSGGLVADSTAGVIVGAETGKRAVENNYFLPNQTSAMHKELGEAFEKGDSLEKIYKKYKEISQIQREELQEKCVKSSLCTWTTQGFIEDSTKIASDATGFIGSFFSKLSSEEQEKYLEFVISHNSESSAILDENRNFAEKLLTQMADDYIANVGNRSGKTVSPKISNFARKIRKENTSSSPVPVLNPTKSKANGELYKSNPKHTLGQGSRSDPHAGIEPRDSFELFEKSKVIGKQRFTIDSFGNVHRFMHNNTSEGWHWAGASSDLRNPLKLTNKQKSSLRKLYPEYKKNPNLK